MSVEGDAGEVRRWFGSVALPSPMPTEAEAILDELVALLDLLDPQLMDRDHSSISARDRARGDRIVTLQIKHVSDPSATVCVDVSGAGAVVGWLGTHEHVDATDGDASRPWTSVVVDVVAAVLRGEYEVERVHRGRRLIRTRVRDAVRDGSVVSETVSLPGWLPLGRSSTQVQRIDFGVRR
ncbi:MAG: hypothetical protein J0I11_11110 [Actinobacteria bacterium]|nr:hypothetical protein [Actinomycetota bacterium]